MPPPPSGWSRPIGPVASRQHDPPPGPAPELQGSIGREVRGHLDQLAGRGLNSQGRKPRRVVCFNPGVNGFSIVVATLAFVLVVVAFGESSRRRSNEARRLATRLSSVERRLNLIIEHIGAADVADQPPPTVLRYLEKGDQIGAINAYRNETGADLKEALDTVKAIAREHGLNT